MVADLLRYYGIDVRDLWRPGSTLTPRYVLLLVEHLPADAATVAAMKGGPEFRQWSLDNYLLASAVNLLAGANHQRAGKKMKRQPVQPPKPKLTAASRRKPARVVRVTDILARRARAARSSATSEATGKLE